MIDLRGDSGKYDRDFGGEPAVFDGDDIEFSENGFTWKSKPRFWHYRGCWYISIHVPWKANRYWQKVVYDWYFDDPKSIVKIWKTLKWLYV